MARLLEIDVLELGGTGQLDLVPRGSAPQNRYRPITTLPLGLGSGCVADTDPLVLASELETQYLRPSRTFSKDFLDKAQRTIVRQPDHSTLFSVDVTDAWLDIATVRSGPDAADISYEEVLSTGSLEDATNSTSITRNPARHQDMVRGRPDQVPFWPGGLERPLELDSKVADALATEIEEVLKLQGSHSLLSVAPGLHRGLAFGDDQQNQPKTVAVDLENLLFSEEDGMLLDQELEAGENSLESKKPAKPANSAFPSLAAQSESDATVDALTESANIEKILADMQNLRLRRDKQVDQHWAHMVDIQSDFINFNELVPELALEYPFELDTFQKQAVYHLERGESVFVAAHTSAGKTVVAEYAIALAQKHMTKTIYTSPIKALSNQKYRDFKNKFEDVGLITGDVQINQEAACLIMTTEILRSMLYKGADLIRDVEFVIFDEVHYVNDLERGVVWEEVIIMLPSHVNLILLSATVPNTYEFADWIGRTKKKDIYVISTLKRPVPLEHHLYINKEVYKIVTGKTFLHEGYKKALASTMEGPTGKPNTRTKTGPSGGGGGPRNEKTEKNMWINLVVHLQKKSLLPVVAFTFSKKRCEENASALANLDLTSGAEKSEIHVFIEKSMVRLKGTDRELPQILRMREMLARGIAVHHGGLLPIMKEVVEILFARGLLRVLFATETFAMGVNMPARTVVFSSIRKHDGQNFRDLLPGEYTQMSGRAGRRGLDDTGMVIIACTDEPPETSVLEKMLLGAPTQLKSQFRLTYTMILNLLRVEALRVEDMIKRSFSEFNSQKGLPEHQKKLVESEKLLESMQKLDCGICSIDLQKYYKVSAEAVEVGAKLKDQAFNNGGRKLLHAGRFVVVNNQFYRNCIGVVLKAAQEPKPAPARPGMKMDLNPPTPTSADSAAKFTVIILVRKRKENVPHVPLHPIPARKLFVPSSSEADFAIESIPFTDIELISTQKTKSNLDVDRILDKKPDNAYISMLVHEMVQVGETYREVSLPESEVRIKNNLEFAEAQARRASLLESLDRFECSKCPELIEHYQTVHAMQLLKSKMNELQFMLSDKSLELLPDYEQRIEVLKELKYIDDDCNVLLKGRVACEINTADELVTTELIFHNALHGYDAAEIVSLLSCMVFQEKRASEPVLTEKLVAAKSSLLDVARTVAQIQKSHGLPVAEDEYQNSFKFGLMEVVYEWARGMPFKHITELTDVLEGSIVRCITRLYETCREVRNAARVVGDSSLYRKMEEAADLIKRDIVFAGSLYYG